MIREVKVNGSSERNMKVILGFFLASTTIVVLLIAFVVLTTEKSETSVQPPAQNNSEEAVVEQREITGTVVFTDAEGKFIRVSVPGEGMYSIGVDTTKVDMGSIEPMSEITFIANEDVEEGSYDYVMEGDSLKQGSAEKKESIDERLERMRTTEF